MFFDSIWQNKLILRKKDSITMSFEKFSDSSNKFGPSSNRKGMPKWARHMYNLPGQSSSDYSLLRSQHTHANEEAHPDTTPTNSEKQHLKIPYNLPQASCSDTS